MSRRFETRRVASEPHDTQSSAGVLGAGQETVKAWLKRHFPMTELEHAQRETYDLLQLKRLLAIRAMSARGPLRYFGRKLQSKLRGQGFTHVRVAKVRCHLVWEIRM